MIDKTRRAIYVKLQLEVMQKFNVNLTIEQIHIMTLHQSFLMKEAMEIGIDIELPLLMKFRFTPKRAERQSSKGKIHFLRDNTLFELLRKADF